MNTRLMIVGYLLGLVGLVAIAFGGSATQGFAPVDDALLIVQNIAVRGPTWTNIVAAFTSYDPELYIPLTLISYQLNYLIGGLEPAGYHVVNIMLHVINSVLIGWVLLLLTRKNTLAIFGAGLFAVHPLNTETVVWLAGRKDLLPTLFFLLSFGLYICYRNGLQKAYVLSVLMALLALLSKASAVTLPAALVLYDLCYKKRMISKPIIKDISPFIGLSGIFMVIAMGGKTRVVGGLGIVETLLVACKSTVFYAQKFLLPTNLSLIYPQSDPVEIGAPDVLLPVIILLVIGWLLWKKWRNYPWLTFGLLFYVAILSPTFLNVSKGGSLFFAVDRYAYLPMLGLLVIAVTLADQAVSKFQMSRAVQRGVGLSLIVLLTLLSMKQTKLWDTPQSLFGNALNIYPESVGARVSLAKMYRANEQYQLAFDTLKEGLQYGDHVNLRIGAASILAKTGRVADARDQLIKAKELDPTNPEPVFSLGSIDEQTGNYQSAEVLFRQAVEMDDSYVIARTRLADILARDGRTDEAMQQYRAALEWNPSSVEAHSGLAEILRESDPEQARWHEEQVNKLVPSS